MTFKSRKEFLFIILACFFVTNAVVAELTSSKLIDIPLNFSLFGMDIGPFTMIVGIIPWPIVFLATDILNEFYGKVAVRRLSIITACLIGYTFIVLYLDLAIPANTTIPSPASDSEFNAVFGQSLWVIIGSIIAFLVSQIVDVFVFWLIRKYTGERMIWLRATGSTVVSQLVDSFIVMGIGFYLPGKFTFEQFIVIAFTNYTFKLLIAVGLTPMVYLSHSLIGRYLGPSVMHKIIDESAAESLHPERFQQPDED